MAVSTDALVDDLRDGPASMARKHRELARLLLAHGQLVHPTNRHRQEFENLVDKLLQRAPDAGKYWEALLTHARWGTPEPPPPQPLEAVETIEALRTDWAQCIEAAFMEAERAELLGCPEGEVSWVDAESDVEVAHCDAPWQTRTFYRLRDLDDNKVIPPGTDRDALANERFIPLLEGTRHVRVLDQYTGRNVAEHYRDDRRGKHWLATSGNELEWLMGLIDRHADAATLSVFTAYDVGEVRNPTSRNEVTAAFQDLWQRRSRSGGLAQLQLFLGPRRKQPRGPSRNFPHDRHIRFDDGPAFTLTAGLDRLRFQQTQDEWTLVYVWAPDDVTRLRDAENRARDFTGEPLKMS